MYREWLTVWQFYGDVQMLADMTVFMAKRGIRGDLFKLDLLLDIKEAMEREKGQMELGDDQN